jgi:aryl-alcohol dehydrogenase-like predicted oxidoreductase
MELETQSRRETHGLEFSRLTLGTWAFAGGKMWGEQDDQESIRAVHAALDAGITVFDSAPGYGAGESERVLGKALEGRRGEALIATKVSRSELAATDLVASCEASLERLRTDVIDLLQIHWPNHEIPFAETAGALMKLKEQGKVRHIGVCNFGPLDFQAWLETGADIVSNQLPYSLLTRGIEFDIVPLCEKADVAILPYSPLMQGLLTGKFKTPDEVPDPRSRSRHFRHDRPMARHGEPGCEEETFATIRAIGELAKREGCTMEALALGWLLRKPQVASVIVGARNEEQVLKNLKASQTSLSADVVAELDRLTDEVKQLLGSNPDMWENPSRFR